MTDRATIAAAVSPVVESWLSSSPGLPLVLSVDPSGAVECRVGLADSSRMTGKAAAEFLGMSYRTFERASFFGIPRGTDRKFSRLQINNLKQQRCG